MRARSEQDTAEIRLIRSVHGLVCRQFWLSGLYRLLAEVANLGSPVLLQWLVDSIEEQSTEVALVAALFLAIAQTANVLLLQQFIYGVFLSGGTATTSLTAAVVQKSMQLPSNGFRGDNGGAGAVDASKVTNLAVKDAASLRNFIVFAHNFWAAPISVVVSTVLLVRCLGWPALVGIALIPSLIPVEKRLAKATKEARKQTLTAADERMAAVRGSLGCIQTLKLDPACWETRVEGRVADVRAKELAALQHELGLTVKNQVLMRIGPLAVALVAFGVHALAGKELTPARAFAAVALFSGIGHPFHVLPKCVALLASARASVERLAVVLECYEELPMPLVTAGSEPELTITDGDFGDDLLHGVTMHASQGLNLLLGGTGSGKTAVLHALIGELPPVQADSESAANATVIRKCVGSTDPFSPLDKRVAYCAENAWLFRDTIMANITIGRGESEEFDANAYEAAVSSVALDADLLELPEGDQTVLGVNGSTISGGQRARVALARAVYSDAKICVLDQPLVSLDVETAKHCFENAIEILRRRGVVVMATSTLPQEWIDCAETVHICKNGSVERCGSHHDASAFVASPRIATAAPAAPAPSDESCDASSTPPRGNASNIGTGIAACAEQSTAINEYLHACGRRRALGAVALGVGAHLLFISKDIVLSAWTDAAPDESHLIYLLVYTVLCVAVVCAHWLRFQVFFQMTLRASNLLHANLFAGVANSPLSFFESTSEGDITSRFAGDTDAIDSQLPGMISGLMDGILSIVTGLLVVIGAAPMFLVALPLLAYCYRWVAVRYRAPAKALKNMDNQTKGPILSLISESLHGIASVRCYGLQSRLFGEFCKRLDDNNRARYSWDAANRWLSVRLELVGSGIVGAAAVAAVLGASAIDLEDRSEEDGFSRGAALAGLAVSSAMFATRSLSFTVRSITGLEQQLNSLQRVVAFAQLPPEPDTMRNALPEDQKALQDWPPDSGCDIELSELVAIYTAGTGGRNALDLTRQRPGNEESVRISAGQRVGVCGRSGSGKSTLAKVLCRALNPASGTVKIGGVDTATIPLKRLRSVVCVVPQSASAGDGGATIRTVIDPGGREDEQDIWQALTLVGMQQAVDLTKGGLDEPVNTDHWSAGEMQLLVLARAVLRKPRVLVLDESCANLDDTNGEQIRDLLRYGDCFARTTVVVIAHRLTDIGACDRVL